MASSLFWCNWNFTAAIQWQLPLEENWVSVQGKAFGYKSVSYFWINILKYLSSLGVRPAVVFYGAASHYYFIWISSYYAHSISLAVCVPTRQEGQQWAYSIFVALSSCCWIVRVFIESWKENLKNVNSCPCVVRKWIVIYTLLFGISKGCTITMYFFEIS